MILSPHLKKLATTSPKNHQWVTSLPSTLKKLKTAWHLEIGNLYLENVTCSYVAPCTIKGKHPAVLKIGLPHEEALHEIEGLQLLSGHPTVQLLQFDKATNTMLLEKCIPGTSLKTEPEFTQDEIICELLAEIWKAKYSEGNFRSLASMVELWNKETYEQLHLFPDPELAKKGCRLKEKLIETTEAPVLLATDLHAGNVLRAERKPWLVIDIKPYIGDRTYDLTQHLLNCTERLRAYPKATMDQVAKLAGVDGSRLRGWLFARLASESSGVYQKLGLQL